ncbi:MAG: hypothetical protein WC488_00315 [Candidatus Micrarchaeia archaeon]
MGKTTILLAFILASSVLFAIDCVPGYEESAVIQALDGKLRPIENASVQITYQIDRTTGKGYATTAPKLTDSSGKAAFILKNQEVVQERVDCTYSVLVTYDNKKAEKQVDVRNHENVIAMPMDVYMLGIRAVDQNGNALAGAVVRARDAKAVAGSDGTARLVLGTGPVNVSLSYGDGTAVKTIDLRNDTDYYYEVGMYDLELFVLDDRNTPLVVDAQVGQKVLQTNESGYLTVKKLITARPGVRTVYRGIERNLDADLAVQTKYYVVYDIHAPKISDVSASYGNQTLQVDFYCADEGLRASGLAPDGLKMKYAYGGREYMVPVYLRTKDWYRAAIDGVDQSGIMEMFFEAKDNEGNIRNVKGFISVEFINETMQGNQSTGGGNGTSPTGITVDPMYIIAAGAGVIILLAAIKFIREKLGEP